MSSIPLLPFLFIYLLISCFCGGMFLMNFFWRRAEAEREQKRQLARKRGVYRITNTITRATYIGATSASFANRWTTHQTALDAGKHDNPQLQRDWLTFGADAFEFAVLRAIDDEVSIWTTETAYINALRKMIPAHLIYNRTHITRRRPAPTA